MIGGDQKRPCKFFIQGNCKFGTNCRDSHDVGSGGGGNNFGGGGSGSGGFGKPKTICDAFRSGGTCKYGETCKFLHEYSPNMDLNLLQKLPLTENKEGTCALCVVEFPILAVAFARRVMFFSVSNPKENNDLKIDGEISCMIVEQKLLAVAYINQNKKAQVLLAPVQGGLQGGFQAGFQTKVLIPDCHDNSIHGMIFLEGKLITASKDCYLRMWTEDLQQQKMVSVASGMSTSAICSIKLIEVSGKPVIATGCEDGSIQLFVWEDKSVPPIWNRAVTISEHNSQIVTSMTLCNGLLYSGGLDGTVCITSTADTTPKRVNSVNLQAAISVIKYFQKADFIIVGFTDGTVHLYKSDGFTKHTWFKVHFGIIVSILCSEDLGLFMVLDCNGVVSCWQSVIAELKNSDDSKEESKAQYMESKKSTFFYPREQKPTHIISPPWIFEYDPKYAHFEGGGKWMLFYPKTELDEKWDKIKKHYRNGELVGIQSLKVSTNFDNPRSSSKTDGVIICYCGRPEDKEKVMRYGQNLVKFMGYTKPVNYKSDEQTMLGTKATGNRNNSLYTICMN